MKSKLIQLALLLESENLTKESSEIFELLKFSTDNESDIYAWETAWSLVSQPFPQRFPGKAMENISRGISELISVGKELENADPDKLEYAGKQLKKLVSASGSDINTLRKFSKIGKDKGITKEAADIITKNSASSHAIVRSLPYVGPIISGLFALKNIYYGIVEAENILRKSQELGVSWYVVLDSSNLKTLAERNKDDANNIVIVDSISKSVLVFWDEFISLITNSIDFIKDVLFLIANIMTLGWSTWLDVGLSFLFIGIEMATESAILKPFIAVIEKIKQGVKMKYSEALEQLSLDSPESDPPESGSPESGSPDILKHLADFELHPSS